MKHAEIRLGGDKEARTISVGNFKQQEGPKTYGQLPDYDEFHGYDLGIDTDLSQINEKIYANFHMPSRQTLKRNLLMLGVAKNLFREFKILAGNDTEGEFNQERMFGLVAKTPISRTFIELVEMDFVYYGGNAEFLRIQDTFSRFPVSLFIGAKKRGWGRRKWPAKR